MSEPLKLQLGDRLRMRENNQGRSSTFPGGTIILDEWFPLLNLKGE
jgi:hypothetical protein